MCLFRCSNRSESYHCEPTPSPEPLPDANSQGGNTGCRRLNRLDAALRYVPYCAMARQYSTFTALRCERLEP